MLEFPAHLQREAHVFRPRTEAGDPVEATFKRTAIVVDDRLAEVLRIIEWRAGNAQPAGVEAVYFGVPIELLEPEGIVIAPEFAGKSAENLPCLLVRRVIRRAGGQPRLRLFEHVEATEPRPWPETEKCGIDIAQRLQPGERRINPAIERNVHRAGDATAIRGQGRHWWRLCATWRRARKTRRQHHKKHSTTPQKRTSRLYGMHAELPSF